MGGCEVHIVFEDKPRINVWYVDFSKPVQRPIDPKPGDYVIYIFEDGRWVRIRW
ncbi:hypothetical protein QKV10_gp6 [Wufeng Rhinolophus pearsonii tupavirus 1]|uniref:Uncharacterized protein n=1 Tax=Wufeng Rhinolophus pearsonii tupavirus 1 TaxID=2877511 RepID=A0AAX2ZAS9_9RHAB|nr:hypothetical protein QKV10_gp6 [Wufeng Rhinolophus pearsonii tupavirus 1]UBB42392.1 hypothetical protein [Wufeng Rhinolophus pearsonii tupavirus 1]WPV62765.1 MAG: hypothetical protein [Wufeng bat tupavirus 1]